jgi:hypothetical protein
MAAVTFRETYGAAQFRDWSVSQRSVGSASRGL